MSADEQEEREYEVCVVVTGHYFATIWAKDEDEAKELALEQWTSSDLQNCEADEVLIKHDGVYS